MRRCSALPLPLLLTFVAVAAAGCGSTSTPSASVRAQASAGRTTPSATTAGFIAGADAICQTLHSQQERLNGRVQALTHETAAARTQLQALIRQSVVFARAADAKLQALPQPPSEAAAIDRLLAGYAHEAAEVSSFAGSLTNQELERQRFFSGSLERTTASDSKLAESLGLKVCAAAG
jgi:hypothetical protein